MPKSLSLDEKLNRAELAATRAERRRVINVLKEEQANGKEIESKEIRAAVKAILARIAYNVRHPAEEAT